MKHISVGVRMNGTIDIDLADEDGPRDNCGDDWNFNNLSVEEAQFLHEELGVAIERARKHAPPKPTVAPSQEETPAEAA